MDLFKFEYSGGIEKLNEDQPTLQTYKFLLFNIVDGSEYILYDAVKRGLVNQYSQDKKSYVTKYPYIKLFLNSSGFGARKLYYSLFFQFDNMSTKSIKIFPFGPNSKGFYFKGRGRFLSADEVKEVLGENSNTYNFYIKQTVLSKYELKRIIEVKESISANAEVRHLRI